jgi:hypothetical protein
MSETERIRRQMEQAVCGEAWHGPAVTAILEGVTPEIAAAKPIPGAHSIWELLLHLTGTQRVMLRRLAGNATPLEPHEDWPPVPAATGDAWRETVATFLENEKRLREAVSGFADERLDEPLVPAGTSAYNNFHGYVQHTLYHAAQMGLLKKATMA